MKTSEIKLGDYLVIRLPYRQAGQLVEAAIRYSFQEAEAFLKEKALIRYGEASIGPRGEELRFHYHNGEIVGIVVMSKETYGAKAETKAK